MRITRDYKVECRKVGRHQYAYAVLQTETTHGWFITTRETTLRDIVGSAKAADELVQLYEEADAMQSN